MSSSSTSSITSSFASSISDKSKLVLNDQINYNNQEADGEGIELIFDLDNNLVEEVIQSPKVHSDSHPQQQLQLQPNKAESSQVLMDVDVSQTNIPTSSIEIINNESDNGDDEEEHVIFDLDNNQVIKNTEVIDMNSIEYSIVNTYGSINKSDANIDHHQQQPPTNQDDEPRKSSSFITITRVTNNNNNPASN